MRKLSLSLTCKDRTSTPEQPRASAFRPRCPHAVPSSRSLSSFLLRLYRSTLYSGARELHCPLGKAEDSGKYDIWDAVSSGLGRKKDSLKRHVCCYSFVTSW